MPIVLVVGSSAPPGVTVTTQTGTTPGRPVGRGWWQRRRLVMAGTGLLLASLARRALIGRTSNAPRLVRRYDGTAPDISHPRADATHLPNRGNWHRTWRPPRRLVGLPRLPGALGWVRWHRA